MRAMNDRLQSLRRRADRGRGRFAVLLLLLAPLCAAACGVHPIDAAPAPEAAMAAHADCHGMEPAADAAPDDAGPCCDEHESATGPERAQTLPDAVIAFTGASLEQLVRPVTPAPRAAPPDPGGRSPGRFLLLLVLSFLE